MKRSILMLASILALFSCKGQQLLYVDSFSRMLEENDEVQLVDVRTPEEFADGHLALAANIDWKGSGFVQKAENALDKAKPVLIYCRSGRRSAEAAQALKKAGFNVYDMKGGILKWKEAGKPTTKYEVERFFTQSKQRVDITLIKHGSLEIRYNGLSIQVDPVAGYGKPTGRAVTLRQQSWNRRTSEGRRCWYLLPSEKEASEAKGGKAAGGVGGCFIPRIIGRGWTGPEGANCCSACLA